MEKNKFLKILKVILVFGIYLNSTKNLIKVNAFNNVLNKVNLNEIEKNEIKGFELKQLLKKGDIKFLIYQHKKSGAFLVLHNVEIGNFSGVYFYNVANNNLGMAHAIEHFLTVPLNEKFKEKYSNRAFFQKFTNPLGTTQHFDFYFKINIQKWDKNIVKVLTEELKNPTFLKDNEEIINREKKRMFLELSEKEFDNLKNAGDGSVEDYELYKKLSDRFIGGKFKNSGEVEEVKKINLKNAKKEFERICVPQNCLVSINFKQNPNYKEILENLSENYFNFYEQKQEKKVNLNNLAEKNPFREIEVKKINYAIYGLNDKIEKKSVKHMARLFFNISSLPKEKQYFLMLNNYEIEKNFKNSFKNLGYESIKFNNNLLSSSSFDNITFDKLFYIDLYGNNEKLFKKEILIKNAKKAVEILIEKLQSLDKQSLKNLNEITKKEKYNFNYSNDIEKKLNKNIESSYFLNNFFINFYMQKSFGLTKNPFSEKYFKITKDGEILDYSNDENFLNNWQNNIKQNFEFLLKTKPEFIDVFHATKKNDEKTIKPFKIKYYKPPINFFPNKPKDYKPEFFEKDYFLLTIANNLIEKNFLKENVYDKGLLYNNEQQIYEPLGLPNCNKKEIEKYIFGEFKKEIKNYKPTEKDFNYFKNKISDFGYTKKIYEKELNELNKFLKDEKRIEKFAQERKDNIEEFLKDLRKNLEFDEKMLKKFSGDERLKETIKEKKKMIDEINKNKNNLEYFIKQIKQNNEKEIENCKFKINNITKKENVIKKIKYKDIVNLFKNLEFAKSSGFEELKNEVKPVG